MKRDMEFVREIMLEIEQDASFNGLRTQTVRSPKFEARSEELQYHLKMLGEAGLVNVFGTTRSRDTVVITGLTWQGHEFLDAVRDPEVWRRTKDGAAKVGNYGLKFMLRAAEAYGKHVIKERLGLDIQ